MIPLSDYLTAGKAALTIVSSKTDARFTYRVRAPRGTAPENATIMFVSVRGEGDANWNYLGAVKPGGDFFLTPKSTLPAEAAPVRAFSWLWRNAAACTNGTISKGLERVDILPSGKCCRCGRELTTPESIAKGIGPECERRCNH